MEGRALQRHRDGERMQNEREMKTVVERNREGGKKCAEKANRSR